MASISEYKNRTGERLYEIYVYVGVDAMTGKKRYAHKRRYRSKKEATLAASRLALDADKGDLISSSNMTLRALYDEWDASYKNTVRESTYERTYTQIRNHVLPVFGRMKINEITTAQMQRAVNKWAKQARRNYKRWFNILNRLMVYAVKHGYISKNPGDLVTMPKVQDAAGEKPVNFWDREELETFFSYIDPEKEPQKFALFRVLAFGGLRRGECLGLTWADINFSDSTISINKTLSQGMKGRTIVQPPKTRKSRRTLTMDVKTMAALRRWRVKQMQVFMSLGINTNKPSQWVFASRRNTPLRLALPETWLMRIEDAHKIEHRITIHGFRHSHASALLAAGATIKEVQERLGHEDVQTTLNIYAHVTQSQNDEAAKKVANYLNF